MPVPPPQSIAWPKDRAVLFVHGVGNAKPGDYAPLVAQVEAILGDAAKEYAMYFFYYDFINDWFAEKQQAGLAFTRLVSAIRRCTDDATLGNAMADFGGDVIWPVLLADGRLSVRAALVRQLQQLRLDGIHAGHDPSEQRVTIIAHSMGCFHVYEALAHVSATPSEGLGPSSADGTFERVILMASPVQLIRDVAGAIAGGIPQPASMYSLSRPLAIASEPDAVGKPVPCTRHFVSITGNLDPVGGYVFRHPYAYMNVPGQESFVDQQQVATVGGTDERLSLAALLTAALRDGGPPVITPVNPHDWSAYVGRHADDLRAWLA